MCPFNKKNQAWSLEPTAGHANKSKPSRLQDGFPTPRVLAPTCAAYMLGVTGGEWRGRTIYEAPSFEFASSTAASSYLHVWCPNLSWALSLILWPSSETKYHGARCDRFVLELSKVVFLDVSSTSQKLHKSEWLGPSLGSEMTFYSVSKVGNLMQRLMKCCLLFMANKHWASHRWTGSTHVSKEEIFQWKIDHARVSQPNWQLQKCNKSGMKSTLTGGSLSRRSHGMCSSVLDVFTRLWRRLWTVLRRAQNGSRISWHHCKNFAVWT